MTARRGRNEGAIRRRETKDKLWEGSLSLGVGANGKRIRKSVYGKSKADVQKKLADLRRGLEAGALEPSKVTVAEYLSHFLTTIKGEVRISTLTQYTWIVNKHLNVGALANVPVQKLTPLHVQAYMVALKDSGVSDRTRQLVHSVLHRALRTAVTLGQIAKNPVAGLKAPRVKRVHRDLWTQEQVRMFLERTRDDRFWPVYVIAITMGMREGEILGLWWTDLDFVANTMTVRRNLSEVCGRFTWEEPKTEAGRRTMAMTKSVVAALSVQKARIAPVKMRSQYRRVWDENGPPLVFPNRFNKPVGKTTLTKEFKDSIARVDAEDRAAGGPGLRMIRFHDLRHVNASLAIAMGTDVVTLSKRLGHHKPSVTLDIYAHMFAARDQGLADSLEGALFGLTPVNKNGGN